jgi:hypothetical protein
MQVKERIQVSVLLFCCCALLCCTDVALSQQEEEAPYQVIRLLPDEIVPPVALIQLGTVLIWVNQDSQATEIQFTNANGMVISCDGSDDVIANPEEIISAQIPCAGLESLCLIQRGEFNYLVQRESRTLKGKIIVQ